MRSRTLGEAIFVVFKQSCASGHLDVAEYLLRALEALEGERHQSDELDAAYLSISKPRFTQDES